MGVREWLVVGVEVGRHRQGGTRSGRRSEQQSETRRPLDCLQPNHQQEQEQDNDCNQQHRLRLRLRRSFLRDCRGSGGAIKSSSPSVRPYSAPAALDSHALPVSLHASWQGPPRSRRRWTCSHLRTYWHPHRPFPVWTRQQTTGLRHTPDLYRKRLQLHRHPWGRLKLPGRCRAHVHLCCRDMPCYFQLHLIANPSVLPQAARLPCATPSRTLQPVRRGCSRTQSMPPTAPVCPHASPFRPQLHPTPTCACPFPSVSTHSTTPVTPHEHPPAQIATCSWPP
ncbi:hypothetical protein BKA81DRAFT_136209 [Phyllosticta paracitricarpa]|uniref:Uncharacterized protein n=1 Tax=Phyllosticta paracitricarpa TaxID=2016321 RepID=A0ABR1MY27_9PEZI